MTEPERSIMRVIGTNTTDAYCGICGRSVCGHTAAGITELIRMTNDPPPERAVLTDLIAELRKWSDTELLNPDTELYVNRLADRAEARLREVQGE